MESIVTFSSDDLLSVENIMGAMNKQDTAGLMVDYLLHRGGRDRVKAVVDEVLLAAVNTMDSKEIAEGLEPAIRESLRSLPLEKVLSDIFQLLSEDRHSRRMLHSLLAISHQVLYAPVMQQILLDNIKVLRKEYEKDSAGRAFVLEVLDLTDERILGIINEKASQQLKELLGGESESYASLKAGMESMFRSFGRDASLQETIRQWKNQYLERLDISGWLGNWIEENVKGERPFWMDHINSFLDEKIMEFSRREDWQRAFDAAVKNFIREEVEKHHGLIPKLIKERLDDFSDDDLTTFVESKVADDLQMIRINGSVVGAVVGAGLYIVVWVAERMWGV